MADHNQGADSNQFVQEFAQNKITIADRAPISTDKGLFWVYYTATSAVFYCRHPRSGTWYAQS